MAGKNTSAAWVCKRVTVCSAHFRNQLYHLSPRTTAPRLREAFGPVWPNAWVPCSQCDTTPTPCRPRSRVHVYMCRCCSPARPRAAEIGRSGWRVVGQSAAIRASSRRDLPGPAIVRRIRLLVLVLLQVPGIMRPSKHPVPCLFADVCFLARHSAINSVTPVTPVAPIQPSVLRQAFVPLLRSAHRAAHSTDNFVQRMRPSAACNAFDNRCRT
jgi:hypothetical protein